MTKNVCMTESEYPITLCQACSVGKKAISKQQEKCPLSKIPFAEIPLQESIFFDFEAFMKKFPEKANDARCDILYRDGQKDFLFIELKVADWFFNVDNDTISGQKDFSGLYEELKSKFENSYDTYFLNYPPTVKDICFSVSLSTDYYHKKWNTPGISVSVLKDCIRKKVFTRFSKKYLTTKCYKYQGNNVRLDVRDCDDLEKLIKSA